MFNLLYFLALVLFCNGVQYDFEHTDWIFVIDKLQKVVINSIYYGLSIKEWQYGDKLS